jgi:P-type Cu2+ transporter
VANLLRLSKDSSSKIAQNLVWATGYNVIAIPLAADVLYTWGVILSPAVGAVLMSASTVIVAINARLLKMES